MRPRRTGSSLSASAWQMTSLAILHARMPTSEWALETGAGGTELTIVPGSPMSKLIGRHRPPLTGSVAVDQQRHQAGHRLARTSGPKVELTNASICGAPV